ncbi:MAG TPA: 50S ribosomal protein L11 methyltransferase [Xanthobacteraceae bacterium]|nr:50S ribosomal protein L11 methyltransferase [Xanthobacteraceae bacterium]
MEQQLTHIVRVATDEATAKRIANLFTETSDPEEVATSAFESAQGWSAEIHFAHAPDCARVSDLLNIAGVDADSAIFETVAKKDWIAASLEGLKPVRIGRFVVHGAHDRAKVGVNQIGIEIEASLAFGTGHHGTTQGCLMAIEDFARKRKAKRTLDLGTGTGVLAIAAARRMRRPVIASDFDPVAVKTARENAQANQAGNFIRFARAAGANAPLIRMNRRYDFVLANILLPAVKELAKPVRPLLVPGATVVLSGLLASQANAAASIWRAQGLKLIARRTLDGWTTLTFKRGRY